MIDLGWYALCLALLWAVFGRSVRTDQTTRLSVRLVMWLVGVAALTGLTAPFYGWDPDPVSTLMLSPLVVMQYVMSAHWRYGVPTQFVKQKYRSGNRRKEDSI